MRLSKIFGPVVIACGVSGCVAPTNGTYSEGPDYNAQRTRIQGQPMRCDVYSSEPGYVQGGRYVFNQGTAVRNCVSTTSAETMQDALSNATTVVYQVRNLGYALGIN